MRWLHLCLFLVVGATTAQFTARAQGTADHAKRPVESQVVVEGGSSVGNIHVFAFADDRRIAPLGIEYDRHSWGSFLTARVDYVAEVLPVVLLNEPAQYGADSIALTTARQVKYGFGFSPVGVRLLWRRHAAFRLYLMGKGGMLIFPDPVLSPLDGHLSFSAQFGGGVEETLTRRLSLRLGYSDFHFSNGGIATRNPGYRLHVFQCRVDLSVGEWARAASRVVRYSIHSRRKRELGIETGGDEVFAEFLDRGELDGGEAQVTGRIDIGLFVVDEQCFLGPGFKFFESKPIDGWIGLGHLVLKTPDENVETREPIEFALDTG